MNVKKIWAVLLSVIMTGSVVSAAEAWLKGPDASWQIRYEDAVKIAKKENKLIYALATGSDWCYWCKKLKADVFSKKEFKDFAQKNLVLLYIDMPSPKLNMPLEQRKYNYNLTQKLPFGNGVPSALVLNADGKVIAQQGGYAPLAKYMAFLQDAVKKADK